MKMRRSTGNKWEYRQKTESTKIRQEYPQKQTNKSTPQHKQHLVESRDYE